jgi:hypothetical protein
VVGTNREICEHWLISAGGGWICSPLRNHSAIGPKARHLRGIADQVNPALRRIAVGYLPRTVAAHSLLA